MEFGTIFSLCLYFALMLGIGFYAFRKSTDDVSGYMLGGRKLGPAVTSLSAGASDMSGWMLMGLPGAMFLGGMSEAWIAIGLLIGALANYLIVAPRLRVYTERASDAITIPDYFEKRFEDRSRILRVLSSVVIVIFFTLYMSSGVVAGGKLFRDAFGLDYTWGLWITAGVVVSYTMIGGFMAVSMTDFVQGCIMFVALILVPVVAFTEFGSIAELNTQLNAIDPTLTDMFAGVTVLSAISLLAWGLGYFGQPHIIVRFMAIRSVRDVPAARNIGMSWMLVTIIGALATGLIGLAYVTANDIPLEDPESVFIVLSSQILFHPLVGGFLLAAILAAIMSTISSQLLVSSSSLTEDFYKMFVRRDASQKELVTVGRISVVLVSLVAVALAYDEDSTVLGIVSNAWAGFGAAFGPVIIASLYWKRMTREGAIAGMVTGAAVVLLWIYVFQLSGVMYEIVPGFIACTLAIIGVSLATKPPAAEIEQTFDTVETELQEAGQG
ncbi:sodium/proline symporter PutP [Glycocaulis profundi]|nr:sodium/proline symporter PutP [Glycocaulis profundi]